MNKITFRSLISSGVIGVLFVISIYSIDYFRYLLITAFVITLGLAFYVLELDFTKENLLNKIRFMAIPVLINVGGIYFISTFFQLSLKLVLGFVFVIINYYLWTSLKKVFNLRERAALFYRNLLITLTFLAVFLGISGVFRVYVNISLLSQNNIYQMVLVLLTFIITYYASSFMASENGADMTKFREYNLVNAVICSEIAWVSSFWIVNYPVVGNIEKSYIGGTPLPALLISIIFYFIWGVISHKVDRSLDRKILNEYILITIIFIFVLFLSARWLPIS
jgi:hypothetical protein